MPVERTADVRGIASTACALGIALALAGCGQGDDVDVAGRSFTSTEVVGHDLVEGSVVTLSFEGQDLAANAGCNTIVGGVSTDGGTLEFDSQAASTLMACDPELMDQDQWLIEFLTSSPSIEVEGATMTLGDDTSGMTLTEAE